MYSIIIGKNAVLEALKAPDIKLARLITSSAKDFPSYQKIHTQSVLMKVEQFHNFLKSHHLDQHINHQQVALEIISWPRAVDEITGDAKIVILDSITDTHNMGAILRNCAAFNIDYVIIPQHNSANPYTNPMINKIACGALSLIKVMLVSNINQAILKLKEQGFWIAGLCERATLDITAASQQEKLVFILGNEEQGIRPLIKSNCDFLYKIKTNPQFPSLNVAATSAIALFTLSNRA